MSRKQTTLCDECGETIDAEKPFLSIRDTSSARLEMCADARLPASKAVAARHGFDFCNPYCLFVFAKKLWRACSVARGEPQCAGEKTDGG